jgi:hypothetical protein
MPSVSALFALCNTAETCHGRSGLRRLSQAGTVADNIDSSGVVEMTSSHR